ncbi:MAG TPA: alpha/beta fold hydrolase [Symbiobacteriaceae bacterium]|jgi:pimeloyl-ACP methyl ester carboxylesterase
MKLSFKDQAFSFELLRAVSYVPYQGADLGECLATAARIKEGDMESWYVEWHRTAGRVAEIARHSLAGGHRVSAREAFIRAHNYYRTAEFFLKSDDPRLLPCFECSRTTFRQGMALLDTPCETVAIPYEGTALPGYWYSPDDSGRPRPTLLFVGGFDSTAEELYLAGAAAAIRRGYNCLCFDGPGQGAPLRLAGMPARVDYEVPVAAAVDYLVARSEVIPEQIALMGMSLGGYYAPRAAAFEKRIAACIAYDTFFDVWNSVAKTSPLMATLEKYPGLLNIAARLAVRFNSGLRWSVANSLWVFGAKSVAQLPDIMKQYHLRDVAGRIACPTLVLAGEKDHFVPLEQTERFMKSLTCPKTRVVFTIEEGGEEHCQVGLAHRLHQVIFDWLDEQFAR